MRPASRSADPVDSVGIRISDRETRDILDIFNVDVSRA